jgi:hypothetical protein
MIKTWKDIKTFYQELVTTGLPLQGMVRLVEQIEASPYAGGVHGETSMHDLRLTQIANSAYPDGPYLRISPRFDGTIEFRYIDTYVREKQWHRVVKEDDAFSRLAHFFDQLCWFGGERAESER